MGGRSAEPLGSLESPWLLSADRVPRLALNQLALPSRRTRARGGFDRTLRVKQAAGGTVRRSRPGESADDPPAEPPARTATPDSAATGHAEPRAGAAPRTPRSAGERSLRGTVES